MTEKILFDKEWRFFKGDLMPRNPEDGWGGAKARAYNFGAAAFDLNDSGWTRLDLPHDFVIEGDYSRKSEDAGEMSRIPEMESIDSRHFAAGSLETGVGWYRKSFDIPMEYQNKRIYICFDGIYRNSDVYLNEYFVGNHKSGYTSFYYDITDFVNFGEKNVIAVRTDAKGHEGWWYEGGGIYRHVWLEVKEQIHIEKWGHFISANVDLETKNACITVKTECVNNYTENKQLKIVTEIKDRHGNLCVKNEDKVEADAWDKCIYTQNFSIDNAHLWSLDDPYLYTAETAVYTEDILVDKRVTIFGIRDIRFDADNGFYLNGEKLKIKGLCCHHDHAGVGIAVPDSVQEYRIIQMKKMGTNAYRTAHYPPTPELLDICDRVGMLVFDETRRMSSCNEDLECLEALIKRDRNHPSVFLWGIGNEEIFSQDRPETARTTQTMKAIVNKTDGTRPITSAVVCWNGKERFDNARAYIPVTKYLDVMGFNYCQSAWDDYHKCMPKQPVIITEASANSGTRGCYSTDENRGRYFIFDSENETKCRSGKKAVKADTAEKMWKSFNERDYLSGIFLWTGFDYRGEPTPMAYPAVSSQFGIFDYCGFEKDNFYYYKSWWSQEDVLHIFPHWTYPAKVGERITVYVYSNFDSAELFVNGKSYGKKDMEKDWYLSWENVVYEPGEVTAKGYRNGRLVMEETIKTAGKAEKIVIRPYKNVLSVNDDTAIFNISVVDKDGNTVPTADNEICFKISGVGKFLGMGNGNPGSHESDKIPVRRAFNGLCQLLVKLDGKAGTAKVRAYSEGMLEDECEITVI